VSKISSDIRRINLTDMKNTKLTLIAFLILASFISCKEKFDVNGDNLCVQNISKNPKQNLLSADTLATIKALFEVNQMNAENFVFHEYKQDDYGIYHADAYQFINGVRVLTNDVSFHFRQDKSFTISSGAIVSKISLSNKPSLREREAAALFVRELSADTYAGVDKDELIKACLDVEFGYYDLNATSGSTDMNFVKAWKVTPKGKNFPIAYFNDQNASVIYYFNGINMKQF
jgi:Zn-dependent metalloprotease